MQNYKDLQALEKLQSSSSST